MKRLFATAVFVIALVVLLAMGARAAVVQDIPVRSLDRAGAAPTA